MKTTSFAYSLKGILMLYSILLLAFSCPFATAAAYRNISVETTTLGESNPSHDQVVISKRAKTVGEESIGTEGRSECISYYRCASKYDKTFHAETINDLRHEPLPVSPPTSTVDPVNPPGNLQCNPRPTGHYRHSHQKRVKAVAMEFCNDYCLPENLENPSRLLPIYKMFTAKKTPDWGMAVDDWSVSYLRFKKITKRDDVYDLSVEMVQGCEQEGWVNLRFPSNVTTCRDILYSAWRQCDNKGRGGSLVAGCVRYGISTRF